MDRPTPTLIGALFIAEGLITPEQLDQALSRQQAGNFSEPLGEILLRSGYISQNDLANTLQLQRELRASAREMPETGGPALCAVILHPTGSEHLQSIAQQLGLRVRWAHDWVDLLIVCQAEEPDMILLDPALMGGAAVLPEHSRAPVWVLPLQSRDERPGMLAPWAVTALSRFINGVRVNGHLNRLNGRARMGEGALAYE